MLQREKNISNRTVCDNRTRIQRNRECKLWSKRRTDRELCNLKQLAADVTELQLSLDCRERIKESASEQILRS